MCLVLFVGILPAAWGQAQNLPPNGAIDTPTADVTITVGQSVNFTGTGTDSDGNTPLTYLWSFGTGSGIADATVEDPGAVQFDAAGTFTVTFTVTDSLGLADPTPATRTITVEPAANLAPNGVIDTPTADVTITEGQSVNFTATGTDSDGNTPLTYLWNFGTGSGIADATVEDPGAVQFDTAGTFTVTFTVTDSLGLADPAPATRTITVEPAANLAPNGVIDTPTADVTITVGQSVNFTGTGTDSDGNTPLTYLWNFGTGSGVADSTAEDPGAVQFDAAGTFIVTFTVTDSLGLADPAPATRTITVEPAANLAPNGVIDTPTADVTITVGQSVNFTGTGTDSDGDTPLTYLWNFGTGSGVADSTAEDPGAVQFDAAGTFIVTFTVTDSLGLADPTPATRTITVEPAANLAPSGVIDTPTADVTITVGQSVNFTGTGTDSDGNTPLTYLWNFGTGSGIADATIEDPGAVQFDTAGTFTVTFTVTDSLGLADPAPATRTIIAEPAANLAPNGVIDTPAADVTITVGQSVDFTGTGTDTDGNTPLTYLWNFGTGSGVADATVEDPGTVTFATAGTFTVTFTVTDSLGLVDPTPATRTITVEPTANLAPSGVIDTPAADMTITVGQSVDFTGTSTDSDGNTPLTYLWNFGTGSGVADATVEDPGAVQFDTAGTFAVTFTVTDSLGLVDPTPATRTITVEPAANLAPNGVIDTPTADVTITVGQSVDFTGTGADSDGNTPLTYLWSFGAGSGIADATVEDPGAVQFDAAGTFTVTFTVTDSLGLADPTPATRTITVEPVVNLAPSGVIDTPTADVTITVGQSVNFTGTGTDSDGNTPLTYLWNFGTGSGVADSTAEDPGAVQFDTAGTFAVTFTVTDSLGLVDPTPATRTITVEPAANLAPNGTIDTPTADVTITVGQSADFTGTATDSDGNTPLTYLWNFGTGSGVADSTAEDPGAVQFDTAGTFAVTFTVTDSLGLVDPTPATRTITVAPNIAPNSEIDLPASHVTIAVGGSVDFSGTCVDSDNHAPLSHLWTFGAGSGVPDSTMEDPGAVRFDTAGSFTVSLTATDALGLSDPTPATRTVTVVDTTALSTLSRSGWSIRFVDSQELRSGSWGPATPASSAIDGNPATFWHTEWFSAQPPFPHEIQIDLGASYNIAGFRHLPRQDGKPNGRVALYEFYLSTDGSSWGTPVASGTFPATAAQTSVACAPTTARYIRFRALSSSDSVNIVASVAELDVLVDNLPPEGTISTPVADVTLSAGETVSFAGSGSDPDGNTPLTYLWSFDSGSGIANSTAQNPGSIQFNNPGTYTVSFTVTDSRGQADPTPATRTVTVLDAAPASALSSVPRSGWSIRYVDSQEMRSGSWGPATPATSAIDGNPATFWHTEWYSVQPGFPHEIQIDLGATYNIAGFRHLPRQDGNLAGRLAQYEFYVSTDGTTWGAPVASGSFANVSTETTITSVAKIGRYVRLRGLSNYDSYQFAASIAELNFLTDNLPPDSTIGTPTTNVTINAGQTVSFAGSGSDPDGNTPFTYLWSFGSGSGIANSTAQNPGSVQFNNPGTYTVSFTVTDSQGQADPTPATRTVTVLNPGPPLSTVPQTGWVITYVDSQELRSGSWGPATPATSAIDGNPATFWHTEWYSVQPPFPHEIQIDLRAIYTLAGFRHLPRQDGKSNGRIAQYEFYVSTNGTTWGTPVATGTFPSSAAETTVYFAATPARYVRLRALSSSDGVNIVASVAELNVLTDNLPPNSTIATPTTNVSISAGDTVSFGGTGSDPDGNTPFTYLWNFGAGSGIANSTTQNPGSVQFNNPGTYTVSFTVTDSQGQADPTPATRTVTVLNSGPPLSTVPQTGWVITYVDSQELRSGSWGPATPASSAVDGNPATFWHTEWYSVQPPFPHEVQIDLRATYTLAGFRHLPRQDGKANGRVAQYEFYVSTNGVSWGAPVASGTFPTSAAETTVYFPATPARYVRFRALSSNDGTNIVASVAELNVLTDNLPPESTITTPTTNISINAGDTVNFSGSGSDPDGDTPLTYLWNFGSGSGIANSTAQNPGAVQFNTPGTYTVSFTVTDSLGQADATPATRTVTVLNPGPVPLPRTGWSVTFVDSQDTTSVSWSGTGVGARAIDGNKYTMWHTRRSNAPAPPHEIRVNLGAVRNITGFRYLPAQDANPYNRIAEFEFYVSLDGTNWGSPVARGHFPNTEQETEILFTPANAQYVRLRALNNWQASRTTAVAELTILQTNTAPNGAPDGTITLPSAGGTIPAGGVVNFAGAGSDPNGDLLSYRWNFGTGSGVPDTTAKDPGYVRFDYPGTYQVSLTVADAKGLVDPTPAVRTITVEGWQPLSRTGWTLHYVDSQELTGGYWGPPTPATNAFDGNPTTFWVTRWYSTVDPVPHELQINLGAVHDIAGFSYLPRQDGNPSGNILSYEFYISADGTNWGAPVAVGAFENNAARKQITFTKRPARYVRLRALSEVGGASVISVAELDVLTPAATTPSVRLLTPRSYHLQTTSALLVRADANLTAGQGVRLVLDGSTAIDDFSAPYQTQFNGLSGDGHTVDAYVITSGGAVVSGFATRDRAQQIGVGDYIVALGDSITQGIGDDILSDNVSLDGRNATAGFTPILADYLTVARGRPVAVYNEGIGGERADQGAARILALVQKHPQAQQFLILFGANDAFNARPSGLGLNPGDSGYAGSYKASMQYILDVVNAAGMQPVLAKVLPALPLNGTSNGRIQQYNFVIDELVADPANNLTIPPPEFYDYFSTRTSTLYTPDAIHPNGLGYQAMAELWNATLPP